MCTVKKVIDSIQAQRVIFMDSNLLIDLLTYQRSIDFFLNVHLCKNDKFVDGVTSNDETNEREKSPKSRWLAFVRKYKQPRLTKLPINPTTKH